MGEETGKKSLTELEKVQAILEPLGVACDTNWLAVVLFARNIAPVMDLYTQDQKGDLQAKIFEQMGKRPLDRRRFLSVVRLIQGFLSESVRLDDLRSQLATERQGYNSLYEEMLKVFSDIRQSSEVRETNIQRMGADTEQVIATAGTKSDVMRHLRGMITEMVSQAKEEARAWQERAKQLERTVNFDPLLSELYSRRALDAQLAEARERCRRDNQPLSMMFIDVDKFKTINDSYGHQVGDGVLRVLSAILSAHALRFSGYPARFGGEELVVLCEGQNEAAALVRAEEIRQDVARCPFMPFLEDSSNVPPLNVTVSIGVAQLAPGQNESDLVLAADQAMYAAKTLGRNRVVGSSSLSPARAT